MNETVLRNWHWLAMRGVIALLFGMLALVLPGLTLTSLAALFAAFALLAGALWTFAALRNRRRDPRWWLPLLLGAASLAVGAATALYPGITLMVIAMLVAVNALLTGVFDIVVAVRLRRYLRGEWLLMLSGIAAIVFGAVMLLFPLGASLVLLAWLIGAYALVDGVLMLFLAARVRTWLRVNAGRSSPATGAM